MADSSAIVLAAGRARRFGRDKRLEPIDACPMFLRTALLIKSVIPDTLVVLGADDALHARILSEHGIESVPCPDAALGMGHSLACGVARRPDASGWFIMPADMPFIATKTLTELLRAVGLHVLAAPVFQGRRGHPVWFAHRYYDALIALRGDEGARSLLKNQALHLVSVDDAGCLLDVDRPEDLAAAL